jgi:hypothetical protein
MTDHTDVRTDARALKRARARAEQAERDARRMRDQQRRWQEEGTYLTRAEFEAGVPCRGCGEPWLDGLGGWPPLLDMTPEQRVDHAREDARYLARHGDCRAHRQSVAGNRTQHCGYCCPPPPLSAEQVETVAHLLGGRSAQPDPASLMVWEVTHTCGHTVRRRQHRDHREWNLYSTYECQECDGEIRGVISAVQVGLMSEVEHGEKPASLRAAAARPKPPSKAALRRRLREAEAQVKSLRVQLALLDEPAGRADPGRHPERDPE